MTHLSASLVVPAAIAVIGWRLRWLTGGGAIASLLVGAAVLGFGGWVWASALVAFFVSGSALTLVGRARKTQPEHRGGGRTAAQVLGTGGVCGVVAVLWGAGTWPGLWGLLPAAFFGAVAAAAADTWATEIGMLSPHPPRMITTGRPVPAGTSGAVTWLGSAAGVAGAALIGGFGMYDAGGDWRIFAAVCVAGVVAMIADSLLGALVQASFRGPDGLVVEDPVSGAVLVRGIPWVTNPVVNLLCTLAGALVGGALAGWL
jgi:uncharacterized protein (TIGR00297 family)